MLQTYPYSGKKHLQIGNQIPVFGGFTRVNPKTIVKNPNSIPF
jgi:hypothetical protein